MKFGLVVFVIMASMSVAKSQSPENQDLQLSISSAEVSVCSSENFVVKVNAKNVGEKPLVIDSWRLGRSFEATWSKNWKDGGSFGSKQLFRVVELGGSDPRLVTLNPGQSITVNRSLRFDDYDLEIGLKVHFGIQFSGHPGDTGITFGLGRSIERNNRPDKEMFKTTAAS
ncbi:MAG: hypothetical protein IPJ30_16300 [Acidobacteria bacterium]|nr:hypothetical protein [Acidobacteriota bacterium]